MAVETDHPFRNAAHFALQAVAGAYLGVFLSVTSAKIGLSSAQSVGIYVFFIFYPLASLFAMAAFYSDKTPMWILVPANILFFVYSLAFTAVSLWLYFDPPQSQQNVLGSNLAGNLTIIVIFAIWYGCLHSGNGRSALRGEAG